MDKRDFENLCILILDDNAHFVNLMKEILRSFGVRDIVGCVEVARAKEIVATKRFDIATVDVKMPEQNGFEFVKYVRSTPASPNRTTPIIMVSAFGSHRTVAQAVAGGAEQFLLKPIRPIDLYNRIVHVIDHPLPYVETDAYFGPERRRELLDRFEGEERRKEDTAKKVQIYKRRAEFL